MERYYLMSSKDFGKTLNNKNDRDYRFFRDNYDNFLEQPLKLEKFVPCDEEGDILEEPTNYEMRLLNMMTEYNDEVYTYNQAKEKVLFEGIEFRTNGGVNFLTIKEDTFAFFDFNIKFKNLTIEDLIQYNLQLTENAVKQIGL